MTEVLNREVFARQLHLELRRVSDHPWGPEESERVADAVARRYPILEDIPWGVFPLHPGPTPSQQESNSRSSVYQVQRSAEGNSVYETEDLKRAESMARALNAIEEQKRG